MDFKSPPPWDVKGGTSVALARDTFNFFYELRAPKTLKFDPLTSFDVVTEDSASGTRLQLTKRREDQDFVVFADSCLIFDGQKRRAMVVTIAGQPSQVFCLTTPRSPKPVDWTKWQRPDYTEQTDATWTFMHDLKKHDRSTNVPPDSFELRFKITESP
jgi:hypothetical protein